MAGISGARKGQRSGICAASADRDGVETQRSCIEGTVGASAVLGHGVAKQFIERVAIAALIGVGESTSRPPPCPQSSEYYPRRKAETIWQATRSE
jgi:hypothetical protein